MFAAILEWVAEQLLSSEGSIGLAVLAVIALAAPLADRYVIRRKRVAYRVQYNSKIGLSPISLRDDKYPVVAGELQDLADMLNTMSVVVIRIRNNGPFDISADDFDSHLEFSFGGRLIWDARISEPSIDRHRDSLKRNLQFLPDHEPPNSTQPNEDNLSKVRGSLGPRFVNFLLRRANAEPPADNGPTTPEWDSVRLNNLSLERGEKFKLVLVLKEPAVADEDDEDDDGRPSLTKDVTCEGHLQGGRVIDERNQPRITWRRVVATIGVLLTGALVATLIASASRQEDSAAITCADGTLRVIGSSAFLPALDGIAKEYDDACGSLEVTTNPTGSNTGVQELLSAPANERSGIVALSDGEYDGPTPGLQKHPVGIIRYAVVVNDSVGVDRLTIDQIRRIYQGEITDWNQIRKGRSLPIRLIGRGSESGSRATFENTVLDDEATARKETEGEPSSNSCDSRDRRPEAVTIRCERSQEVQVRAELRATEGALGYLDLPSANEAVLAGENVTIVQLGEDDPQADTGIDEGYPFWAIEYLYTYGQPEADSAAAGFLKNLRSGTARADLQDAGYTPCINKNGSIHRHCN